MAEPPSTTTTTTVRSLNDFPDHILYHILSSFPTTVDAIETSLLSRKWRNLWLSTPSLNFSCQRFFTPTLYPNPETLRSFVDFVEQALILRPPTPPLFSFKLQFDFPNNLNFTSHVNSWIRFAVSNNAEILDLDLFDYYGNALRQIGEAHDVAHFEFALYVLRASKVRVLKLRCCSLALPKTEYYARFYSLRSLSLDQVVMTTDQMLVDLLAACVNVEALELSTVKGCKHFKIRSSKLRELTLKLLYVADGSIEIVAPNLYSLNMLAFHMKDYALTDVSSLVEANVDFGFFRCWEKVLRFLGHVERLTSPNMWAQLLELKDVNPECFILHNLKYVELRTCYTKFDLMGIMQLLVLSPNLQTLILAYYPDWLIPEAYEESISEDLIRQLSFNMRNLRHVKMKSFMGTDCEKYLLMVLLKTAVILERIEIIPAKVREETPQPPIILYPQFNGLQDFENFVRPYPRQKTLEERNELQNSQGPGDINEKRPLWVVFPLFLASTYQREQQILKPLDCSLSLTQSTATMLATQFSHS